MFGRWRESPVAVNCFGSAFYSMDFKFADLTGEEPSFELELQGAWEHTAYGKYLPTYNNSGAAHAWQ